MARLVPARPKLISTYEQSLAEVIDTELDDSHVAFLKKFGDGFLVSHPERGHVYVTIDTSNIFWDPDLEDWREGAMPAPPTPPAEFPLIAAGVLWCPFAQADTDHISRVACGPNPLDVIALIQLAFHESEPTGVQGINSLIQSSSPGATPYEQGMVTPAQKTWREERASSALGAQPPLPSLPSPGVTQAAIPVSPPAPAQHEKQVWGAPVPPAPEEAPLKALTNEAPLVMLLASVAEQATGSRRIYLSGVMVPPSDLVRPDYFLPALLAAVAEDWAPLVAMRSGLGGFTVRLRPNPEALLGYEVAAIQTSATLLLVLPLVHRIRTSVTPDGLEINMDETMQQFIRWIERTGLDTEVFSEIDIRVPTKL